MTPEIILKIITEFPDAPFGSKNPNKVSNNDFTAISTPQGAHRSQQIRKNPYNSIF